MSSKKGKKSKTKTSREPQTAADCLEAAEWAFLQEDFAKARQLYARATELEPENADALDRYGAFLADTGDAAAAVATLQRAVALSPEQGFEKYMYLAQLLDGTEAQAAARKGIAVCRKQMTQMEAQVAAAGQPQDEEAEEQAAELAMLKEQLSSCLCSLAELLLNGEAELEEAGQEGGVRQATADEMEALLSEAEALWPTSPEPLQIRASLRQQQERPEEALALLRASMAKWFQPPREEDEEEEGEEKEGEAAAAEEEELGSQDTDEEEDEMDEDQPELPSYEFRFETAKMLLELDEDVEAATQVLEQLLEENDAVPSVHLLLALCYQGAGELEAALECAAEGQRWAKLGGMAQDDEVVMGLAALEAELREVAAAGGGGEGGGEEGK